MSKQNQNQNINNEDAQVEEFTPPEEVHPLKFVVKYEPPVIGMLYRREKSDPKKYIYNILLNGLVNNPNVEQVALQLFEEHPTFLNEQTVCFEQIANLVARIQQYYLSYPQDEDEEARYMEDQQQAQLEYQRQQEQFEKQQQSSSSGNKRKVSL